MMDSIPEILARIANYKKDTETEVREKLCEHCPIKSMQCPTFAMRQTENKYIASCKQTKTTLWHWPNGYSSRRKR